jgi:hypothetical protein
MRIDGLTLDLRERNAWEAFDLGIALARSTGLKLFIPYSVVFIALAALIHLGVHLAELPVWSALIILWWLKPALDRVALAVLAQAVFGAAPGWRETLGSLRRIPRNGWLYSITLGRLDFARSFHLPVRQLEGQSGKAARERIRLLDKKLRGNAIWLNVAIWHFVFVLVYGANGLIQLLAPEGVHAGTNFFEWFGAGEESLTNQYLYSAAFVLAECVLEPFYIAGGFALYLSRRTALEGWDLEVAFKRMAARIEEARRPASLPGALSVLLAGACALALAVLLALPGSAMAQEDDDEDESDNPAAVLGLPSVAPATSAVASGGAQPRSKEKIAIQQILASPDFEEFGNAKRWVPRNKPDRDDPKRRDYSRWGDMIESVVRFLTELVRGGIWIVAVLILGWLLYLLSKHFGWFKGAFSMQRAKPDVMFGLDLRPETLPDDVPAAARALLANGNMRAALALLYRAALSYLIHERDLDIQAGDTEGDCARRVRKAGPAPLADYFDGLMETWGLIAYAGRKPPEADVTRLIDAWAAHFAVPRADAAPQPPLKAAAA